MPRKLRASRIETRTARLRLPISKKPVFRKIAPGVGLGYRRNTTAGTWTVRVANGKGGNWIRVVGTADDYDNADGSNILDFWQAQDRAKGLARASRGIQQSARLTTVLNALEKYEEDLKSRGGDIGNVARVRVHMNEALGRKSVFLVSSRELRGWRDNLAKTLAPASVNRTINALRAALNLAADHDEGITSRRAWEIGLKALPDAEESRNVVLADGQIRLIVEKAYGMSAEFGLLTEVAAVTGARVSQIAKLTVRDLQADRENPRLMMPTSRKGRKSKFESRAVPITTSLSSKLQLTAVGRPDDAPLLLKPSGEHWRKSDHSRLFTRAVMAAGLNPDDVTLYAFRHSSITRQILAGIPIRVVATTHDTSVLMIESTYSRHIADHADEMSRKSLIEFGERPLNKVVRISGGAP